MALSKVYSRALLGMNSPLVSIETDVAPGLPTLSIVGLPETAVKESKDRVRSALFHAGFEFPEGRVTINLAPADLPKEGSRYDLPIALGILAASNQLSCDLSAYEFMGELALGGDLRAVSGVLPTALATHAAKRALCLPSISASEAALLEALPVYGAAHLNQVCAHLLKRVLLPLTERPRDPVQAVVPELQEVQGQLSAKRALSIAAAGGHHLLLIGPPGTGKTLLANRLPGLLPPLNDEEALEVAALYSLHQGFQAQQWRQRPFRAPHHTASHVALVGGGRSPIPGELSLAHHGVLFLDELPEFPKQVLEVLRQPLESNVVHIARAKGHVSFPAQCQLIAAMNPCPCGYLNDPKHPCRCTPAQVQRYRQKISGPLLDRIDLQVWMDRQASSVSLRHQEAPISGPSSKDIQGQVFEVRAHQLARQQKLNAHLSPSELRIFCKLKEEASTLLEQASDRYGLSLRSQHRILKVARTIADLQQAKVIEEGHLLEALSYRLLDPALRSTGTPCL